MAAFCFFGEEGRGTGIEGDWLVFSGWVRFSLYARHGIFKYH